ncbi:hypothetical protein [Rufibacter tibetensis]|uniref:DUF4760 domain-containing protein n=1 Tax=Rufibacter tibetensis TaxID=512763 RepID=A0A0P0CZ47_9BACT|nr:hypothetical protein [Rufibacter tibetensis]ALJ00762.1 hypothetical protein DC20_19455 [Rufibacter tibetensis]
MKKDINNANNKESILKEKKERFSTYLSVITVILSLAAFVISMITLLDQHKMQAYTYWQDYLNLAVENPKLANGLTTIDKISIIEIAKMEPGTPGHIDSTRDKFVEYAWFVTNTLNAAEIVHNLHSRDKYWRETILDVLKKHTAFYKSRSFNFEDYEEDFQAIIKNAIAKKMAEDKERAIKNGKIN